MKNKIAGIIIIIIALMVGLIIYLFNRALTKIVNTSCSHGPTCPMWDTINTQTTVGIIIMLFIVLIGLYFILSKDEKRLIEQIEPKEVSKENYSHVMVKLDAGEKNVFERVIEAKGTIFQSDLAEKTGFTKVKVTRILDRLEGKQIIERKRRGMTNVVVLKGQ